MFSLSYASLTAIASWSGQEVGLKPHLIPLSLFSICSTVSPSVSDEIPCKFQLHPPVNLTFDTMSPFNSKSICVEQVPFVLYEYSMIFLLNLLMCSRYLLKMSHFGCISDILSPFSLRKCHCISKKHIEILQSEDFKSTYY